MTHKKINKTKKRGGNPFAQFKNFAKRVTGYTKDTPIKSHGPYIFINGKHEKQIQEENKQLEEEKENLINLRKKVIKKILTKKGINISNGNELNSLVDYILHAQNNNKSLTFNNILKRKNEQNLEKALILSRNNTQNNNEYPLSLNNKLKKHYLKYVTNL